ncbi:MAG: DUF4214 domain-containing protein [Desulfobacterium sp.]
MKNKLLHWLIAVIFISGLHVSHVNATTVSFNGTILEESSIENAHGTYSGTQIGASFSANFVYGDSADKAINIYKDTEKKVYWKFIGSTFGGNITDGVTSTIFPSVEVRVNNDWYMDEEGVDLLNTLFEQNINEDTPMDMWAIECTTDNEYNDLRVELIFIFYDTTLYSGLISQPFPQLPPCTADVVLFFIEKEDRYENPLFFAVGRVDTNSICNLTIYSLTQIQISQLYVSIFGRASEGEGNTYWQTNQEDLVSTANVMLSTDSAKNYFGTTMNDDQDFIEHIYENTLGKTIVDDPDGIAYWVEDLRKGKSRGEVIVSMINAAQEPVNAGNAQDQFNNKVDVSNYVADNIFHFTGDFDQFINYINNITHEHTTVELAKDEIDTFVGLD